MHPPLTNHIASLSLRSKPALKGRASQGSKGYVAAAGRPRGAKGLIANLSIAGTTRGLAMISKSPEQQSLMMMYFCFAAMGLEATAVR